MLILITGGGRSGKSGFAVELARSKAEEVVFIATCEPRDEEMAERAKRHRENRPAHWETWEERKGIAKLLEKAGGVFELAIVDCITMLVSNYMLDGADEKTIQREIEELAMTAEASRIHCVVVTNEVGSGIIPENELARRFRDIAGTVNQILARHAAEVYLVVCGIPQKLKGQ